MRLARTAPTGSQRQQHRVAVVVGQEADVFSRHGYRPEAWCEATDKQHSCSSRRQPPTTTPTKMWSRRVVQAAVPQYWTGLDCHVTRLWTAVDLLCRLVWLINCQYTRHPTPDTRPESDREIESRCTGHGLPQQHLVCRKYCCCVGMFR